MQVFQSLIDLPKGTVARNTAALPGFRSDPYPYLKRLREADPVHWSEELQAWLVTRYDDVVEGLSNRLISANRVLPRFNQLPPRQQEELQPLLRILSMWPLMLDRPDHSRFRTLINKSMTRSIVQSFAPLVRNITNELLDAAISRGGMDAIADLADPLPLYVVSEMIGAPRENVDLLKRCSIDIVTFFGAPPENYLATALQAQRSVQETADFFRDMIRERRTAPREDLMSKMVIAQDRDNFGDDEIIATCIMMVFAGFETTTNLLGNGLMLLLDFPEQLALLRRSPELMRPAIDEMLRYEAPVQRLSRMASGDLELRESHIREGDLVFFMAAAANRDPAVFPDPDRFDITRDSARHLAFGTWIHMCPGSTLAHLEAAIVFGELLRRVPNMHHAGAGLPEWQQNLSVRALSSLPVRFG